MEGVLGVSDYSLSLVYAPGAGFLMRHSFNVRGLFKYKAPGGKAEHCLFVYRSLYLIRGRVAWFRNLILFQVSWCGLS